MEWNPNLYQDKHSFVSDYGKALLEYIPMDSDASILDLGCGTGDLTYELFLKSKQVLGIDSSKEMINKAKSQYPHLNFQVMDALSITWNQEFDYVFSNAVFHWISNQPLLLGKIFSALNIGGKLVCEFGAKGNIKAFQTTFQEAFEKRGYSFTTRFFLPSVKDYQYLLESAGFKVDILFDYDRPTPLKDGENGLRNWVKQFFSKDLEALSINEQEEVLIYMEDILRPTLWDKDKWVADYRRLRVIAHRL